MFQIPLICESTRAKAKLGWLGHIGSEQPPCFVGILEIYEIGQYLVPQNGTPNWTQQRSTNSLIPSLLGRLPFQTRYQRYQPWKSTGWKNPCHINRATFGFLHCSRDASGETVFVRMRIDKLKSSIISPAYVDIVQSVSQNIRTSWGPYFWDLTFVVVSKPFWQMVSWLPSLERVHHNQLLIQCGKSPAQLV